MLAHTFILVPGSPAVFQFVLSLTWLFTLSKQQTLIRVCNISSYVKTKCGGRPGSHPSVMILLAQFSSALMCSAPFLSSSDAPLPIHRYALLSPVFSRKASLEFRLVALTRTWNIHDVRHMMNKDLLRGRCFFCGDRCSYSRRVLTSAILVMGPRLRRTWKSRVGGGGGCFPRRDVPCLYTIRGFDLKRLSRWGGSLPWHTLTWQHTQKTPYCTWKTLKSAHCRICFGLNTCSVFIRYTHLYMFI